MARRAAIIKANSKLKYAIRKRNRCTRCGRPRTLHPQVRHVPHLLPQSRARRLHPGRDEGVVVREEAR